MEWQRSARDGLLPKLRAAWCRTGCSGHLFLRVRRVTDILERDGGEVVLEHFLAVLLELVGELVDPLGVSRVTDPLML